MATQPQLTLTRAETNRQNAQHSTGPRTQEGKARIRTNALKHGLTAKDIFLAEGESERYESLLTQLTALWKPESAGEHDLVLTLRDAYWRRNSIPALHINLATLATEEHMEAYEHYADQPALQRAAAQAAGYRANARLFDQFSRHEGRLTRLIQETEGLLAAIRQERLIDQQHEAQLELQRPTKQTQPAPAKAALTPLQRLEQDLYNPARKAPLTLTAGLPRPSGPVR